MLIGVISDTHDHVPHIEKAVNIFKENKVDLVLHAGDYCSPFAIPPFEGLPLKGIFGNNDGDIYLLMNKFREIEAEAAGYFLETNCDGIKIALYHGTYGGITNSLVESGRYDLVITGHTHEKANQKKGSTLVLNPGTANGFDDEATIALIDTESLSPEFVRLN